MTIYYDMSAAVHGHPGLGRYAESLGRALLRAHGESMTLFYYGPAGTPPPRGLEEVPRQAVTAGRKAWRMAVALNQLARRPMDDL